jgi:DNA polymerase-3 subunit epsilon
MENNKVYLKDFVAIDLETATCERSSICEIGATVVKDFSIQESISWLVQPPDNEYDGFNISIHGITPSMTKDKPDFKEVWKHVEKYVNGSLIVAHNTGFDMYALRDAFDENAIQYPSFQFCCTYRLSTYVVDGSYSYSLPIICEYLNIDMGAHHRAKEDSEACAKLFMKCIEIADIASLEELEKKYSFNRGRFEDGMFIPSRKSRLNLKAKYIIGDSNSINEDSIVYGKKVVITGALKYMDRYVAQKRIADIGGIPQDRITRETDVLIVGMQDYKRVGEGGLSTKQKKAMKLIEDGYKIDILSEEDFLQNI